MVKRDDGKREYKNPKGGVILIWLCLGNWFSCVFLGSWFSFVFLGGWCSFFFLGGWFSCSFLGRWFVSSRCCCFGFLITFNCSHLFRFLFCNFTTFLTFLGTFLSFGFTYSTLFLFLFPISKCFGRTGKLLSRFPCIGTRI